MKKKLLEELENSSYSFFTEKEKADTIVESYVKLFNFFDTSDYKISFIIPTKLLIKRKDLSKKVFLENKDGRFFLNNEEISPREINEVLQFVFSLDKNKSSPYNISKSE